MKYQLVWILFPIVTGVAAFINNRDVIGWLFAGLFLGPFGLLVACLPKIDRTAFVVSQIKNVEFHVKRGSSVKYISDTLSLTKDELEQTCLRLLSENKITKDDCIKVLGSVPFSRGKVHYTPNILHCLRNVHRKSMLGSGHGVATVSEALRVPNDSFFQIFSNRN